jgi:nitrogen regulatory protein P-II 1
MKQIIAIVRPYLVEPLLDALRLAPIEALQLTEAKGFGRQKSYLDRYSATEYNQAFLPKVELTLYVDDLRVEEVLKTISDTCQTGRMGDGKLMVLDVPNMISIPSSDGASMG